jgi:hypothetical protein
MLIVLRDATMLRGVSDRAFPGVYPRSIFDICGIERAERQRSEWLELLGE